VNHNRRHRQQANPRPAAAKDTRSHERGLPWPKPIFGWDYMWGSRKLQTETACTQQCARRARVLRSSTCLQFPPVATMTRS